MTCTKCGLDIQKWEKWHRTKRGTHHAQCPTMHGAPSVRQLAEASDQITTWLRWEQESLSDFHAYGQAFGVAGNDVYSLVLADALRFRGLTLEQLRGKQ